MDLSKFIGKFRDATRDHLRRMNELLLELEEQPDLPDHGDELMREIHTLKGESRMMGFADLSELSHAIEDLLKAQQQEGFRALSGVTDLLFAAFDDVERLLREKLGEGPAGVDVAAACARLTTAAGLSPREAPEAATEAVAGDEPLPAPSGTPVDISLERLPAVSQDDARSGLELGDLGLGGEDDEEGEWPDGAEGDEDPQAAMREAFGVPQGLAQEIGEGGTVAAPGARAVSLGGGPQKFLARYRDSAEARLQALQAALTALGRSRSDAAALGTVADEGSALAEESRQLGFEDAAFLAASCAALADWASRHGLPDDKVGALVAAVEALGRLVAEKLGGDAAGADVGTLVARLAPPESPESGAEPPPAAGGESPPMRAPVAVAEPGRAARPHVEETIRVSVEKLDRLAMLSTDIYLGHAASETRLRHLRQLIESAKAQVRAVGRLGDLRSRDDAATAALEQERGELLAAARTLRRGLQDLLRKERDELLRTGHSVVELRERVRELQMLPVSTLFDLHPRMVRDLSRELGKQVRLVVEGSAVELDRRVLDEIRDPMVHLLRNAVDHGIELPVARAVRGKPSHGTITVAARAEGDHVVVEVRDDGAGIDAAVLRDVAVRRGLLSARDAAELSDEQAINLIFAAGFSSKTSVSDISGRGVGLDVVREKVERLEGSLSVWSQPGRGTRFEMRLPLTLAVARLLLVRAGGLLVALPSTLIEEVVRLPEDDVRRIEGYEAMDWKERTIPLVSLAGLLEREAARPRGPFRHVAVVRYEGHVVGFVVDALAGEREAIVKRLADFIGKLPHVAGATILTTGEVVTVLHVPQMIAATMGVPAARLQATIRVADAAPAAPRRRLLVVDDSIIVRDMMKSVLEGAGFEVTLAVDGLDGLEKQLAGGHDAVVTDVEMPRMDGFELARNLRANAATAGVPVVMVTTLDTPQARETGLRSGASAYLVKNLLDMSHLVDTITRLLS